MSFLDYQERFETNVHILFKQTFEQLIIELDFVQLYHDLKQIIKRKGVEGVCSIETRNNQSFVRIGELNTESNYGFLLLSPFEGKHPNSIAAINNERQFLSIQINDYFRHLHYIITFDTDLTQIIIEKWAIDQNEVWVHWKSEKCVGELNEFNYILKLLAFIGDSLYELE